MATQTVEFPASTGRTLTAKLFALGSDTQTASVSATEATNRKGIYTAAYTDAAAADYNFVVLDGSSVPAYVGFVTLTLTTATFYPRDSFHINVGYISGDSTAADNAESFFDGTGYAGTNNVIPTVTTLTGHTAQTGDSFARLTGTGAVTLASLTVSGATTLTGALTATHASNNVTLGTFTVTTNAVGWNASWDAEVQSEVDDALKATLTEGYRSTNAVGSVRDLLYEIIAHMGESAIVSTTKTLKKIDGATTAKTYTLDSSTAPTSITETT